MNTSFFRSGLIASAALSFHALGAQDAANVHAPIYELEDDVVSAGPLPQSFSEFALPLTILDAAAIRNEQATSLGSALDGQPGISASSFAGGASRPIVRGFDGPRVRVLESGIEAVDASALSPDHGVAVEPLLVERIEVLRGPSTLLYGGSAIGGVVNVIDREIPRTPGTGRVEGAVEARYDTASEGESVLGYGSYGGENWAVAATGLHRDAEDYEIPDEAGQGGELENSFFETDLYSIGGSWFVTPGNYLGLAYSEYESEYGIPGEEAFIDLERERVSGEIVVSEPVDWIAAARLRGSYTDYQHIEFEGPGEPGTVFDREGWNLRFDTTHNRIGPFDEGVFGIEADDFDLEAIGEESFISFNNTETRSVFLNEHVHMGDLHLEFGGRLDQQEVDADDPFGTGADGDYDETASSLALSLVWDMDENQSLTLALRRSERHPTPAELFANGAHLAIDRFEIGDPDLDQEVAYGIDLGYRWRSEAWTADFTAFLTEFEDFIFLADTGVLRDPEGRTPGDPGFEADEALQTARHTATDARFYGFEGELEWAFLRSERATWSAALLGDYVRATDEDNDEDLPRIPPLRIAGKLSFESGPWDGSVLLRRAFKQDDTAANESDTSGYTELKANLNRRFDLGNGVVFTAFLRADNLLDEEIRHHTSFLKDAAPLPGRSVVLGGRFAF